MVWDLASKYHSGQVFYGDAGWYKVSGATAIRCVKVNEDERDQVFSVAVDRPTECVVVLEGG